MILSRFSIETPADLVVTTTTAVLVILFVHFRVHMRVISYCDRFRIKHKISKYLGPLDAGVSFIQNDEIKVTCLNIYPLKSGKALPVKQVQVDRLGFIGDRRLMAVRYVAHREVYRFITQRQAPHLITVTSTVDEKNPSIITLSSPEGGSVKLDVSPQALSKAKLREVGIWQDEVYAADLGKEAAQFIQKTIKVDQLERGGSFSKARIVSIIPKYPRFTGPYNIPFSAFHFGKPPQVSLADEFPLLICTEESLQELNNRLKKKGKEPVPMSRFRPNIVLSGAGATEALKGVSDAPKSVGALEAFDEDTWKVIQIGEDTTIHVTSGCPRCKLCCIDQDTGEISIEPCETLGEFREFGDDDEPYFGVYGVVQQTKGRTIKLGDKVKVMLEGIPAWED